MQDLGDLNTGELVKTATSSASSTQGGEVTQQGINNLAGECLRLPLQPLNQDSNFSLNAILHLQILLNTTSDLPLGSARGEATDFTH